MLIVTPSTDQETVGISPIHLSLHGSTDELADLWRSFEQDAVCHVFQCFAFIDLWQRYIGAPSQVEPRIVVGRDVFDRVAFILPFGRQRLLGASILKWLGGRQADYLGGLFSPSFLKTLDAAAFASLWDRIINVAGPADLVQLDRQPAVIDRFVNPFRTLDGSRPDGAAYATYIGADFEAYYVDKRSSRSRRWDRVKRERLEAEGAVSFVQPRGAEINATMRELFDLKSVRLAKQGLPNPFRQPGVQAFYTALAIQKDGPATLACLRCGDDSLAISWGLHRRNRYYYLIHSITSGDLARHSPGRWLMYELMKWFADRGISMFDFTIGDESYKADWCELTDDLFKTRQSLSLRGQLLGMVLGAYQSGRRFIKESRALRPTALWINRQFTRSLRG